LGGVGGGHSPPPILERGLTPLFQLFPKGIESFLGGVKGGDFSLLY